MSRKLEVLSSVVVRKKLRPSHLGSGVQVVNNMSKIDEVWSLLEDRRGQSADRIAQRVSLPAEYVKDILFFFAKYGFAEIEVKDDGTALVRSRVDAPSISTTIKIVREFSRQEIEN